LKIFIHLAKLPKAHHSAHHREYMFYCLKFSLKLTESKSFNIRIKPRVIFNRSWIQFLNFFQLVSLDANADR
jgi:hypothetical protein